MEARKAEKTEEKPRPRILPRGVTFRAVLISFLLVPANSYWLIQTEAVRYASFPTTISLFYNVIFVLLIFTAANRLLQRFWPEKALSQAELCVVYIILCLTSCFASHDCIQVLAPIMAHPFRFANPVNQWAELFLDYIPPWLSVRDEVSLRGMYEGGTSIFLPENFRPWLIPAAYWVGFTSALYLVTLSMASIFRRRWIESEKLTYPIIQLPLEMAAPDTRVFRDRMLWLAFGIAFGIDLLNGLHVIYPSVPQIPVKARAIPAFDLAQHIKDRPWNAMGFTPLSFYPFIIGLGLLLPKELVFSCWFFYWGFNAQRIIAAYLGWTTLRGLPYTNEQALGAYVGLSLFILWTSRRYLREVWKKVLGRESSLDDSKEPVSYRMAVIYIFLGFAFLIGFSVKAGMAFWYAMLFFALHFTIALAVTRIRAEMGMPAHDLHYIGPNVSLTRFIGTIHFDRRTLTINQFYHWFNRAYRAYPMPHQAEAFKLAERTGMSNRALFRVMAACTTIGMIVAFWAALQCYYNYGIQAKTSGSPRGFGNEPWAKLAGWLNHPEHGNRPAFAASVIGMLVTIALMATKMRYTWWPLHPVGYAISENWSMDFIWCPLFIAWAIKAVITRYGGAPAYRRAVPFAFGLILGDLVGGSWWTIYGIVRQIPTYSIWQ